MTGYGLPEAVGFHMPAEWEPHEATWLAWPHEKSDWPGKFECIPWIYGEIVRHLSNSERVSILVNDSELLEQARDVLSKCNVNLKAVNFFQIPTNRSWTRDFCPTFVRDGATELGILNWRFNGWAKYENSVLDDEVASKLSNHLATPMWTPLLGDRPIVLEGGSIDVNGAGTILTTEECLLSNIQARNPGFVRLDYETVFRRYLGATHTLWLRHGIAGDDTHGHIDDLARFVAESTVLISIEEDPCDPNFGPLQENLALLREMSDSRGKQLKVSTLPMPQPVFFDGQRLPASYANFYIANSVVLVPTFNDRNDRIALETLSELFPDREIIGVACTDLVLGLGAIHCMTQQQPRRSK